MARSREFWYNEIIAEKNRHQELNGISSTSKVSIFALIADVFAFVSWLLDTFFDKHSAENTAMIEKDKAHRVEWYGARALEFQYGQAFNRDLGKYENIGLTDAQIAAQKIVVKSAVNEVDTVNNVGLRIKLAREVAGDLAPLEPAQLAAFVAYMDKVKDGGVNVKNESLPPDSLKLDLDIFYDPLVLNGNGARIDGTAATPVTNAINAYLRELKFNGEYANTRLADKLQTVEGVILPVIKTAWAKFGNYQFAVIDERYIPDAGYIRIAAPDLSINWRPYV
jgi:hypothetical protein